jgi:catechol 2,3-dioxygenase-like lactoylglutathione lyase family enzyme
VISLRNNHTSLLHLVLAITLSAVSGLFDFSLASPKKQEPGLLFYLSGSQGFKADYAAGGKPEPNFLEKVKIIPDGAQGPGFECEGKQLMSYWAPGNIYAERGTLSFFWRAREPVGKTEFPIFRVGFADHSSWDMVWLRIDYNGHGFDAFVTDVNLARIRVSTTLSPFPKPDQWIHLVLSWDETTGIRFYINGRLAAQKDSVVVLYAGLDQFGPHSRVIAPSHVQSAYNFQRGGDIDEIRIYDRMLSSANIIRLAKGQPAGDVPNFSRSLKNQRWQSEWQLRYGWNRKGDIPPYLGQQNTCVRKVEIQDVYDLKRWWWKGTDGIRETTWPGVYNRSRLPGRNDYFHLPDWDCYSLSGKSVTFFMPDEPWNHLEISGAAWGNMSLIRSDTSGKEVEGSMLFQRPKGQEKTFHRLAKPIIGQKIQFTNVKQEMPIGELSAYYVNQGNEPSGICTLHYFLTTDTTGSNALLQPLLHFINGRYLPDERTIMVAVPKIGTPKTVVKDAQKALPVIHVLIPCTSPVEDSVHGSLDSSYVWEKIHGGLDGIAIDVPAMNIKPTHGTYIPLNIQIKDPNWPMRNMLDFSFSVKPNEARTVWLDTRDRILAKGKSLYLTLAAGESDFGSSVLEGAKIRLIFKSWHTAYREHVQDRFTQVRDNYANLIEERTNDPRLNLFNRFEADIKDLLDVDPTHYPGQNYLYDSDHHQKKPDFVQPSAPQGIPLWAFRQIENLRYFKRFVLWYINHRQISNGEFGGGLSDDDDLTACWPSAMYMGCEPEKIKTSVLHMLDAIYDQGMFTNGLSTIQLDGLHAYEDGIEAQTQALLVDYGSPKQVERLMETVRALDERIMLKNKSGHRHFRSSYFSGTKRADESVWEWSLQPHQFLLLQPVLTLAEYNGNLRARQLAIDMADGLLAHARKDTTGKIILDSEINFSTDSARVSPLGSKSILDFSMGSGGLLSASSSGLQLLWAVYRMTGEKKYLQPLLDLGESVLGMICGDAVNSLNQQNQWGKRIVEKASASNSTDLYEHIAWQMTGNKKYLENYYADQIESNALREYINTEGSLWDDRVVVANRELQRSRLGGIASARAAIQSGHAVSWNFKAPATEESMAILVPFVMPRAIKIVAYALDSQSVEARMTPWNIEPGTWIVAQGLDRNGDDEADTILSARFINLERGKSVTLNFAPHATTILSLGLYSSSVPYGQRPDFGIGKEDIRYEHDTVRVRVHSLGSLDAPASTVTLVQGDSVIASSDVPALHAPVDLIPKFTDVVLQVPKNIDLKNCSVSINPGMDVLEITDLNNHVELSEIIKMNTQTNQKPASDRLVSLKNQPRLEHIAFNVKDPASIAQWYCAHLSMKIIRKSPPPENTHFISDDAGNIAFEFYHNADAPVLDYASIHQGSLHLAFMVDDVNAIKASLLAAGATLIEDVTTTAGGDQIVMLRDPWGLAVQFVKRFLPLFPTVGIRPEHFALNVSDPQSMTNWYIGNLGMKIVREGTSPNYASFFTNASNNMMIEVFQNAVSPVLDMNAVNPLSLHVAFMVDDVRSIRNALVAAGATLVEDLKISSNGDEILMVRDPWGVPIQCVKRGMLMLK